MAATIKVYGLAGQQQQQQQQQSASAAKSSNAGALSSSSMVPSASASASGADGALGASAFDVLLPGSIQLDDKLNPFAQELVPQQQPHQLPPFNFESLELSQVASQLAAPSAAAAQLVDPSVLMSQQGTSSGPSSTDVVGHDATSVAFFPLTPHTTATLPPSSASAAGNAVQSDVATLPLPLHSADVASSASSSSTSGQLAAPALPLLPPTTTISAATAAEATAFPSSTPLPSSSTSVPLPPLPSAAPSVANAAPAPLPVAALPSAMVATGIPGVGITMNPIAAAGALGWGEVSRRKRWVRKHQRGKSGEQDDGDGSGGEGDADGAGSVDGREGLGGSAQQNRGGGDGSGGGDHDNLGPFKDASDAGADADAHASGKRGRKTTKRSGLGDSGSSICGIPGNANGALTKRIKRAFARIINDDEGVGGYTSVDGQHGAGGATGALINSDSSGGYGMPGDGSGGADGVSLFGDSSGAAWMQSSSAAASSAQQQPMHIPDPFNLGLQPASSFSVGSEALVSFAGGGSTGDGFSGTAAAGAACASAGIADAAAAASQVISKGARGSSRAKTKRTDARPGVNAFGAATSSPFAAAPLLSDYGLPSVAALAFSATSTTAPASSQGINGYTYQGATVEGLAGGIGASTASYINYHGGAATLTGAEPGVTAAASASSITLGLEALVGLHSGAAPVPLAAVAGMGGNGAGGVGLYGGAASAVTCSGSAVPPPVLANPFDIGQQPQQQQQHQQPYGPVPLSNPVNGQRDNSGTLSISADAAVPAAPTAAVAATAAASNSAPDGATTAAGSDAVTQFMAACAAGAGIDLTTLTAIEWQVLMGSMASAASSVNVDAADPSAHATALGLQAAVAQVASHLNLYSTRDAPLKADLVSKAQVAVRSFASYYAQMMGQGQLA